MKDLYSWWCWGVFGASYSQPVLHQHFDEKAPSLPAQAQERGLLKGYIVVSDVHQRSTIVFSNKWGDARQTVEVERAVVRGGQHLGAEAELKWDSRGMGGSVLAMVEVPGCGDSPF